MNTAKLIEELKLDEGYRRFPYKCTAGKITIGYGRNIEDVGISEKEAVALLKGDIASAVLWLDREYGWFRNLSDNRQRALSNMVFNLGPSRFMQFRKMIQALSIGHFDRAALEAMDSKWYSQVGDRAKRIVEMIREG